MKPFKPIPPKRAQKLLTRFLRDDLVEEVLGDLEEKFYSTLSTKSLRKAQLNYWRQVFNYLRPFAIKKARSTNSNNYTMFQNYLKIGWRSLFKEKGYSIINIGGLATGMTVAILLSLWVYDEFSFNKHYENYDRIVQIMRNNDFGDRVETNGVTVPALAELLRTSYPDEFEKVGLLRWRPEENTFATDQGDFNESGYYVQPQIPEILSLKMIHGRQDGLKDKNAMFLSASLANKMFGESDPLNQIVRMNGSANLLVTGVYEDLPKNATLSDASYLATIDLFVGDPSRLNVWDNYYLFLYAQLSKNADIDQTSDMIKDAMLPHVSERSRLTNPQLFLLPMSDWHLHSQFKNGNPITSERLKIVWLYSVIAIFVLSLACINFMNLSTAQSEKRAKEIGVRKSIGSTRLQLIAQFLTESLLVAGLAFILSLIAVYSILPWFNNIADKSIQLPLYNPWFWMIALGCTLLTGVLAGSYPAFYLSSFSSIKSLKGTYLTGSVAAIPRKVLVVFQFTVSISLIIGTIVVYQQIQHAKDRPLGYVKDGLIMFRKKGEKMFGKSDVLRDELRKTGAVLEMGEASYPLTNTLGNNDGFQWRGKDPSSVVSFNTIKVNHYYGKAIGWEMIEGRDFNPELTSDMDAVIISESAKDIIGFDNPIGEELLFDNPFYGGPRLRIIGVVNDLVKRSPFQSTSPAIYFLTKDEQPWTFLRLSSKANLVESLTRIESVFEEVLPSVPFEYKFMKGAFAVKFRAEERIGQLATFFAIITILISCLGLFGLAAFVAEKRTKEIGIRKVLGASIADLWQMLSRDFVVLVIISCAVAIPTTFYLLEGWLQQYDYRTNISGWVFLLSSGLALVITMATISHQTLKVARMNPVKSLRSE